MTMLFAVLAGIVGAAIGLAAAALLGEVLMGLGGVTNITHGNAMAQAIVMLAFGGLGGLGLGVWVALRFHGGHRSFGAIAGRGAIAVTAIVGVVGAVLSLWAYQADDLTVRNARTPQLVFEIRLAPAIVLPESKAGIKFELVTDRNTMPGEPTGDGVRRDGDRTIVTGAVDLYFKTSLRQVTLTLPGQPARSFALKLPANPAATAEFTAWTRVDWVTRTGGSTDDKPDAGDDSAIRYRVERFDDGPTSFWSFLRW